MNRFEEDLRGERFTQAEQRAWMVILLFGIALLGLLLFVGIHWQTWDAYIYETTGTYLTVWIMFVILGIAVIGSLIFAIWPVIDSVHFHIAHWIFDSMEDGGWWSKL